jgi:hypothetical protein
MNHEISPRIRSFLSGLAAIALTTVIATTLVESVKPVLMLGSGESFASVNTVACDYREHSTLVRSV